MLQLHRDTLKRRWPHLSDVLIDACVAQAPALFAKYGFEKPLEVAVFMAHCTVEIGGGREIVENLNYRAQTLVKEWPRHFPTIASALPYAHNPRKLANYIYEPPRHKDLGNRPDSEDGWNLRGRGPTNVTGRDGYAKVSAKMGVDFVSQPDLINDPRYFLEAGLADFVILRCLEPAKRGDMRTSCKRLNGGYTGYDDRVAAFHEWQAALAAEHGEEAVAIPIPPRAPGVIRQGDTGFEVKSIQQQLSDKGYACGADDGEFHEATRDAVNSFKADNGLPTDGEVDAATKAVLATAPDKPIGEGRALATADDLRDKGSRTITAADSIGALAKAKIAIGTAAASAAAGVQSGEISIDTVQDKIDQAKQVYSLWDGVKDTISPLLHNPVVLWGGLALVVIGIALLYHSRAIILARLDDHRSGVNLGR